MPSRVRWFLWLSLAAFAYSAVGNVLYLYSAHYADVVARLPPEFRAPTLREDTIIFLSTTVFWSIVTLPPIWFAAYRRQNWARWTFAGVFAFRRLLPFAIAARYHMLSHHVHAYFSAENWTDILSYPPALLTLTAIWLVFAGSARTWFDKPAPAAA